MRGAASGGRPRAMLTSSGSCLEVCGVLALGSFKLVPLRGRPEADRQSELLWEFRPRRSLTSSYQGYRTQGAYHIWVRHVPREE
jgi:hypothetical protein